MALAQKRRGREEKKGCLSAFTNILDITQVRISKTYFFKRKLQFFGVSCFRTIAKKHMNPEKNPSEN